MSILSSLPHVIERHELKYAIPADYIEPVSQFLRPYCSLDHHSALADDHFYQVNSLYFDTRGLEFLQQRMYGKDGRFNIRVRCYGDEGAPPYYLEIKRKSGTTGKKYRAVVNSEEWPIILTDPAYRPQENGSPENHINKKLFLRIATTYAVEPKILTQYRRRAFFSNIDNYARVTMDISMKYRLQDRYDLRSGKDMLSYDNPSIYSDDYGCSGEVVLELKCNIGEIPLWMLDLITTFQLKQQGFSKYMSSSLVSSLDNGIEYMDDSRIAAYYENA